jgi:hypothetical protein
MTGTCVKILEDITKWANDSSSDSPRIFCLTGQAGSGKTTIAYTLAKRFEKDADQRVVLGSNVLCSRQFEETQERTRIVPTIAYDLARKCKPYANALYAASDFDAVDHDVVTQLKDLLIGPWQQSQPTCRPERPLFLIVIDGLDEIKGDGGLAFLRDLLTSIDEYDLKGFKFLVTSRSDPEVVKLSESFASKATCDHQEVRIEKAKVDVEMYLKERLKELNGRPELDELVKRAGGLFIYAATAVRYLTMPESVTVGKQIEMLNDLFSKSPEMASSSDATLLVDKIYQQIMLVAFSNLDENVLACRLRILYTFLCTAKRTSTSTVAALVPDGAEETVRGVLRDLHAVLYTQDDRVFWYHASFPDFIFAQARSNCCIDKKDFLFSCNKPSHHQLLAESCFRIMKSGLRFNMGNITSSFLFDSDNAVALSEQVNQNINASLKYSSRYWAHHLACAELINTDDLCRCISDFLQIRILFWIEGMNLLGFRDHCTPMLQHARQWALKVGIIWYELCCIS